MSMPGFTADVALGRTSNQYRTAMVLTPESSLIRAAANRFASLYVPGISTAVAGYLWTRSCCRTCMGNCLSTCVPYHPKAECIVQCNPICNSQCEAFGWFDGRGCAGVV